MRIDAKALQAGAFAAALLSVSTARAEISPFGIWIDHTGRGAVEITNCNGKLCGHVAWVKNPKDAEGCGEQIIGDVKPVGGGVWDRGWIYDPDRDSKFDVELTPLSETKLQVVGYAGTKWLSETMTWKRAPTDLQKCSKTNAEAPAAKDKPAVAAVAPAKPAPMQDAKEAKVAKDAKKDVVAAKPEEKTARKIEDKADAKAKDTAKDKTDAKTEVAKAAPREDAAAMDEDEEKTEKRGRRRGKAIKELAQALNVKKIAGGRRCKMDVPYVDMVVTFPCDER